MQQRGREEGKKDKCASFFVHQVRLVLMGYGVGGRYMCVRYWAMLGGIWGRGCGFAGNKHGLRWCGMGLVE